MTRTRIPPVCARGFTTWEWLRCVYRMILFVTFLNTVNTVAICGVPIIEKSEVVLRGLNLGGGSWSPWIFFLFQGPCLQVMSKKKTWLSVIYWYSNLFFFFCSHNLTRHKFPNYKFFSKKKKMNHFVLGSKQNWNV